MTYDLRIDAADKPTMYRDLASALQGLVTGEPGPIANMANASALIFETLPDVNWVGFYRNVGGELVVGPFQGRPACIRMSFDEGVCGAAAKSREVQRPCRSFFRWRFRLMGSIPRLRFGLRRRHVHEPRAQLFQGQAHAASHGAAPSPLPSGTPMTSP